MRQFRLIKLHLLQLKCGISVKNSRFRYMKSHRSNSIPGDQDAMLIYGKSHNNSEQKKRERISNVAHLSTATQAITLIACTVSLKIVVGFHARLWKYMQHWRLLQDKGIYSRIFLLLLQLVVRWGVAGAMYLKKLSIFNYFSQDAYILDYAYENMRQPVVRVHKGGWSRHSPARWWWLIKQGLLAEINRLTGHP